MLLHSKAFPGAYLSTSAHSSFLKSRFSGPDSWMMCASSTAAFREVATRMLDIAAAEGSSEKKVGRFSSMY